MARLAGFGGSVSVGGSPVAGIKNWTIDYKAAALKSTGFDSSGADTFVIGITDWSGKFEGFKDGVPQALASVTLLLKESATVGQNWTGTAILTSIGAGAPVDGLVTYAYTFQGTGTLTVASA